MKFFQSLKTYILAHERLKGKILFLEECRKEDRSHLCQMVKDLLYALEDNKITPAEIVDLRKKAYKLLLDYNFDKQ